MGKYKFLFKDTDIIMAIEEKIKELKAELEQVTKQHSEAVAASSSLNL